MTYRLGDFELLEPLGKGGMATVWLSKHTTMGFEAAVKLVTSEISNEKFMRAFEIEARNHAALVHPAIAALHDFGHVTEDDEAPDDLAIGTPYLVMSRAQSTLRGEIDDLDWPALQEILNDILAGLAFAHAHRVIHRDLKPENVLVFDEGVRYRLTDFGIAQPLSLERVTVEDLTHQTAGTPHYMPPEQLRGQVWSFGPWTDLYALGCLTYELVCGRCPFVGTTIMDIARQQISAEAPPLTPRFAVPDGLDGWIQRLVLKDPFARFARAADARHALAQLGQVVEQPRESRSDDPSIADTIVDDFATDETMEATGEVLALGARHRNSEIPAAKNVIAPFEEDWKTSRSFDSKLHEYLGPGLFAMREPGQVGFERIRDVLWRELHRVSVENSVNALILSGTSGAPSSSLAEWLSIRSHELGAATDVRTFYTPTGGPYDGVPGLIAHGFHLVATQPKEMANAIAAQLGADDDVVLAQCDILANEVRRARNAETQGPTARSSIQLFEAFSLLLERLTAERPVVMWLDDVHHSQDGLALVDHLLGRELPILIVMTVGPEGVVENSAAARALEIITKKTEVLSLEISPYPETVQASLLDSLISLERGTRDRIVETTKPDVTFMRALIAKLIDDRLLHFEHEAFTLPAAATIPENAGALYRARLAEVMRDFGESGMIALSAAAALGAAPTHDDWSAVVELEDVRISPDLVSALARKGLARTSNHGIAFVDEHAHQAVIELAKQEGSWARLNESCATYLARRDSNDPAIARRRASHLWEVGNTEQALKLMSESISSFVQTQPARAQSMLRLRQKWLDETGLWDTSTLVIDQLYLVAACELSMGRIEAARAQLDRVKTLSAASGYELGLARAGMYLGHVSLANGAFDDATLHLQSALALFQSLQEDAKCGGVHLLLGYLAYVNGDPQTTLDEYRRALSAYERAGESNRVIQAKVYLGHALVMADDLEEAEDIVSEAAEDCRERGEYSLLSDCLAVMAEVERFRGNYEDAGRLNAQTAYWRRLNGRQAAVVTRFNDSLVRLAQHDWDAAAEELTVLLDAVRSRPDKHLEPLIEVALAMAHLGLRQMGLYEDHLDQALELQGSKPDRDFAWTLQIGASFAASEGMEAAERLGVLSEEHRTRLGLSDSQNGS